VPVVHSQEKRPQWLIRSLASLAGAAMFVAPLAALVLLWAIVVPLFGVNSK
jgi:taurine transport system permease protein